MADGIVEYLLRIKDQASASLKKATRASKDLTTEATKTTRQVDKMGDEAAQTGRQVARMGQQTSKAAAQAKTAGTQVGLFGRLSKAAGTSVSGFAASIAAIGFAGAVRGYVGLSQAVADLRNDLGDASTRSGLAAETLQGLRRAAEGTGLSFGELAPGLDQFAARLSQARRGTGPTAEAFRALGVEVKDSLTGNLRDTDEVFRETVKRLQAVSNPSERSALAFEALGRSGGRMLQALSGGELEQYVEQAKLFGLEYGPEAAKSAAAWQDASAELALATRGLKGLFVDAFGLGADTLYLMVDGIVVTRAALRGLFSDLSKDGKAFITSFGDLFESALLAIAARFDQLIERGRMLVAIASGDIGGASASVGRIAFADSEAAEADRRVAQASAGLSAAALAPIARAGVEVVKDLQAVRKLREQRETQRNAGGGDPPEKGEENFVSGLDQTLDDVSSRLDTVGEAAQMASADLAAGLDNFVAELERGAREAQRVIRLEAAREGIGLAQSVLGGNLGGALSQGGAMATQAGALQAGAALGVAGAGVGALTLLGQEGADGIRDKLDEVQGFLLGGLKELPQLIGEELPEFAVFFIANLIKGLIANSPDIFRTLLFDLPGAIGEAVAEAIGVRSERGRNTLRGTTRGAGIGAAAGAVIGGLVFGIGSAGILAAPGAAVGAKAGAAVGAGVGAIAGAARGRSAPPDRSRQASRADAALRTAPGLRAPRVPAAEGNPFDALARQYDREYGTFGRASAQTIRGAA